MEKQDKPKTYDKGFGVGFFIGLMLGGLFTMLSGLIAIQVGPDWTIATVFGVGAGIFAIGIFGTIF